VKAIALVNSTLASSHLCKWLEAKCEASDVDLIIHVIGSRNREEYTHLFEHHTHIISGEFGKTARSRSISGKNVLWVSNSLINPASGVFVDGGGYFTESNLCTKKTWTHKHNADISRVAMGLGWKPFAGGSPQGPVLVTMQVRDDMALRHFFPLGKNSGDLSIAFLRILQKYLPRGKQILIRPHPNEVKRSTWKNGDVWREDWELDIGGTLAERLPQCSALVTVNSTCASEAAMLGIPIATLGLGSFTGSGATFECHEAPSRLTNFFNWSPCLDRCVDYVAALIGRHYLPYDAVEASSEEFNQWLFQASTAAAAQSA